MTLRRTLISALRRGKVPRPALWRKAWHVWLSGNDKAAGRSKLRARPLRLHLEINDYCNLKCVMCSRENPNIPKDSGALSLETVQRMAPLLKTATYVGIAGNGEPFMHTQLLDILEYIRSHDCVPSTITNCTLLRQPACDRLAKLGPSLLMASIDGGAKETFETIRKGANFDRIVENLERLRDAKARAGTPYPVVNFITCLMRQNLDDLENIVRLAHRVGAAEINVQNLFPYHDGAWEHIVADFDAIDERIMAARSLAAELGVRVNYSPMGFNIEKRLEHARSKGSARAPASGLQLNGREREIKTVGKLLSVDDAEAPRQQLALVYEPAATATAVAEPPPLAAESDFGGDDHNDESDRQPAEPQKTSAPPLGGDGLELTALEGGIYDDDYVEENQPAANGASAGDCSGCSGAGNGRASGLSAETHRVVAPAPQANAVEGEPKYYCQNVFQQFHVNVQGEARVCCFWTQGSLGNIRDTPAEEMWNSKQFQGVRKAILQGDLPPDCQTCHNLIPFDKKALRADMWREIKEALKL